MPSWCYSYSRQKTLPTPLQAPIACIYHTIFILRRTARAELERLRCGTSTPYTVLYMISAETLRLCLSDFSLSPCRFLLPEKPGVYLEQGCACPERSIPQSSNHDFRIAHRGAVEKLSQHGFGCLF